MYPGVFVRKRSVRNGLQMVLAALVLIIVASFFNNPVAELFSLGMQGGSRIYNLGIFWAGAIGGYGVVLVGLGLVQREHHQDAAIRLLPVVVLIAVAVMLFMYLMTHAFFSSSPVVPTHPQERLTI